MGRGGKPQQANKRRQAKAAKQRAKTAKRYASQRRRKTTNVKSQLHKGYATAADLILKDAKQPCDDCGDHHNPWAACPAIWVWCADCEDGAVQQTKMCCMDTEALCPPCQQHRLDVMQQRLDVNIASTPPSTWDRQTLLAVLHQVAPNLYALPSEELGWAQKGDGFIILADYADHTDSRESPLICAHCNDWQTDNIKPALRQLFAHAGWVIHTDGHDLLFAAPGNSPPGTFPGQPLSATPSRP